MTAAVLAAAAVWVSMRPRVSLLVRARRWQAAGLAALAGFVVLVTVTAAGAPVPSALAVVLAATSWGGQRLWTGRARARVASRTRQRVLECCEHLAAELAAGQPPAAALSSASLDWPALAPVAQSADYGGDVPSALRRASSAPGAGDLRLVAAAWQVSHRTGQGLADALARVAATLRDIRATERVVQGELASARATARLVAGLPVVALLIGTGSGGDPLTFLFATLPGIACLAVGLALMLVGLAWIDRIAAGAES